MPIHKPKNEMRIHAAKHLPENTKLSYCTVPWQGRRHSRWEHHGALGGPPNTRPE
jgi:hypothetical protein